MDFNERWAQQPKDPTKPAPGVGCGYESFQNLAMDQAAPSSQTPFDTCPTCEALARTVMMDQTGAA